MANIDPKIAQAAAGAVRTALPVSTTPGALTAPIPTPLAPPPPDPAKVAQLAAGAQGGQGGIDAYKQAQVELDRLQAEALTNARNRANLLAGAPEAQGFEALAQNQYNRSRANLATSQAASQGLQAANRAAFDKYFGQLKGDMGAINDYIKNTLGGYESKKRAAAEKAAASKGYDTEILGETTLGLPKLKEEADLAKTALDRAIQESQVSRTGANVDMLDQQRHAIQSVMERDTRTIYDKKASAADKAFAKQRFEKNKTRLAKVEQLERDTVQKNKGTTVDYDKKIAQLQADYDKKLAASQVTPEDYARQIATSKYGYSPVKAAGKFTPDKFYPKQETKADTMRYGERAVGLAQKLNINGGAKRAAEILNDTEVIEDMDTLQGWSDSEDFTLADAKRELSKQYLSGENKDRDKYNVLVDMAVTLPWKREK